MAGRLKPEFDSEGILFPGTGIGFAAAVQSRILTSYLGFRSAGQDFGKRAGVVPATPESAQPETLRSAAQLHDPSRMYLTIQIQSYLERLLYRSDERGNGRGRETQRGLHLYAPRPPRNDGHDLT